MADKLHQLIQSLSKSEKRYFKIHAKRFSDRSASIRMQLFDVISKQNDYNNNYTLKKLGPDCNKNRFAVEKVNLYNMILDSLIAYHSKSYISVEILQALQNCHILISKGLYKSAHKLVKKYKKLIYEEEGASMIYLPNIISLEKRLFYSVNSNTNKLKQINDILDEYKEALQLLEESNEVARLTAKSNHIRNQQCCPRDPATQEEIKAFLKEELLQDDYAYKLNMSKWSCLRIKFHMFCWLKQFENLVPTINQVLENLPTVKKKKGYTITTYALNLQSKMDALLFDYAEDTKDRMHATAKLIRSIPKKYKAKKSINITVQYHILESYVTEMRYYVIHNDIDGIKKLLPKMHQMEEGHAATLDYAKKISYTQNLYFDWHHQLSKGYFLLGDLEQAAAYNEVIRKEKPSTYMAWDYRKCALFSLLIYYELQDFKKLKKLIPLVEKVLNRTAAPYRLERLLINTLQEVISENQTASKAFNILNQQIKPLLDNPYEQFEQSDFDYWYWVASKTV